MNVKQKGRRAALELTILGQESGFYMRKTYGVTLFLLFIYIFFKRKFTRVFELLPFVRIIVYARMVLANKKEIIRALTKGEKVGLY